MKFFIFNFTLIFLCLSCSKDDINDTTISDSTYNLYNYQNIANQRSIVPCSYSFENVLPNSTIEVSCLMNLEGKTIVLPQNVRLLYDGGDIINGTLIFEQGVIDGELLNNSLHIKGPTSISTPTFEFIPSRWNLIEGNISLSIAKKNKEILESTFLLTKSLGTKIFKINEMDAFFAVGNHNQTQNFYPSKEAINIPSDFILEMTDQTHLRVFPNNTKKNSLIAIRDASNVTIRGGNLHGDRDMHDYSGGGTHEWGHLIELHAATNIIINGLTMQNAAGDGMKIHDLNFTFQPNHKPSRDIIVTHCIFDSNRRNNLSITSGYNITIENSTFLNAGIDTPKSKGTAPKFAIDIEAHRERNDNDTIIYYERAHDITIQNNIEKNSASGGFVVYIGENVTIQENEIETSISWSYTTGTKIKDNRVIANPNRDRNSAIIGGRSSNIRTTFNNVISGNYIEGFKTGITLYGRKNSVYLNKIINCKQGLFLKKLSDSRLYANTIYNDTPSSLGIVGHYTTLDNVTIYNSTITVKSEPFKFVKINFSPEANLYTYTVKNNIFNSTNNAIISNVNGLSLIKNRINTTTTIYNGENLKIDQNIINSKKNKGLHLREINLDVSIIDNMIHIESGTSSECIAIDSTTSQKEVEITNNSCFENSI
ncbi:hypothetical protein ACE939_06195 [Aquimarina sp. W85]|uniref:hypothetical protein n=1 Tax=Aquimarina rhodophyticola TaxID=3342246 RepID=UPI0036731234